MQRKSQLYSYINNSKFIQSVYTITSYTKQTNVEALT